MKIASHRQICHGAWVALIAAFAACGGDADDVSQRAGGEVRATTTMSSSGDTITSSLDGGVVELVAIGDSDATGVGDESSKGWVGRYAELLESELGVTVDVTNRAADGRTSAELRDRVESDSDLRDLLEEADVVLIGIGGSDLNAADEAMDAGECVGIACFEPVMAEFRTNLDAIMGEVARLVDESTLLRGITPPATFPTENARYWSVTEQSIMCDSLRRYGGDCADIVLAFNGESGDADAYANGLMTNDPCCYPSGDGQQLIAQLLFDLGPGQLRP